MAKKSKGRKAEKKKSEEVSTAELVDLTPDQLKKLAHPRPGFEEFVGPLVKLANARGSVLGEGIDLDATVGQFEQFQKLTELEKSAKEHLEMVQDTRALLGSRVWKAMLELYARAQAVGRTDEKVAQGIQKFGAFMAQGPRKKPGKDKEKGKARDDGDKADAVPGEDA